MHLLSVFSLRNRALIALITIVIARVRRHRADRAQAGAHPVALAAAASSSSPPTRAQPRRGRATTSRRRSRRAIQGVDGPRLARPRPRQPASRPSRRRSPTAPTSRPPSRRCSSRSTASVAAAGRRRPAGDHLQRSATSRSSSSRSPATSSPHDLATRLETLDRRRPQAARRRQRREPARRRRPARHDHPGRDDARRGRAQHPVDPDALDGQRRAARRRARSPRTTRRSPCRRAPSIDVDRRRSTALPAARRPTATTDRRSATSPTVADRRRPGHRHLARQRRAVAHHRDHEDARGNTVEVSRRSSPTHPRPRGAARRQHEVHRRLRPGAVHRAVDRQPRDRRACSASSSP